MTKAVWFVVGAGVSAWANKRWHAPRRADGLRLVVPPDGPVYDLPGDPSTAALGPSTAPTRPRERHLHLVG